MLLSGIFATLGGLFTGLFSLLSNHRLKSDIAQVDWSR
jgi:hypothetical protein